MRSFSSAERLTFQESEGSFLTHSLSSDTQNPTECCIYVTQHGYRLVDTTSDYSIQTGICAVHSRTNFLFSIRSWTSSPSAMLLETRNVKHPLWIVYTCIHTVCPFIQLVFFSRGMIMVNIQRIYDFFFLKGIIRARLIFSDNIFSYNIVMANSKNTKMS